jgi:pyruvate/2-oxoglutarate/acetoin dehydrogenase E1 component
VVVASEDCKTAGVAAEITAIIQEEAFDYLDAPIKRVSALDVPIGYSRVLEGITVPQEKNIIDSIKTLVR